MMIATRQRLLKRLLLRTLACLTLLSHLVEATAPPPFKTLEFTAQPNDTVVKVGDKAMLPCSAKYGNKDPTVYSWKRNSVLLRPTWRVSDTRYRLSNGTLLFVSITPTGVSPDPARYQCIAEVSVLNLVHRIATPEIQLSLADLPPISSQPQNLLLSPGLSAMFRCYADGHPKPRYVWKRNGIRLLSSSRILLHSNGEILEILSVNSTDDGQYQCQARNSYGSVSSAYASLTVRRRTGAAGSNTEGPSFAMKPWDTAAVQDSTALLFCGYKGMDSTGKLPTGKWLKDGDALTTQAGGKYTILGTSSLQVTNVSLVDDGVYTCRTSNEDGAVDAEAKLSVKVPPYFITRPQNTYGRVNEDIVLNCEIGGNPAPEIIWLKDSDEVQPSQYYKVIGHRLKILGLMMSDSGYFQCMGSNDYGKIQAVAQLIVCTTDVDIADDKISSYNSSTEEPGEQLLPHDPSLPPVPSNLRAAVVSQTYVALTWTVILTPGASAIKCTVTAKQLEHSTRLRTYNTTSRDYTVEGLTPNTRYLFTVVSYNKNGRSVRHAQIQVTTAEEVVVSEAVRNMKVTATGHRTISVTWEAPSVTNGPIINYKAYYYSHNQSTEEFKLVSTTSVVIAYLHPYTTYHIRVVALNRNGPGTPTREVAVRTFSAKPSKSPTDVVVEAAGTTVISIRWSPPPARNLNGLITGYKIRYRKKDGPRRARVHTTDASANSYDITGLVVGATYMVRIAAVNVNGSGEFTSWQERATYLSELDESRAPGKPSFIQLKAFAREMIVSWGSPADSEEVRVRGFRLGYGIGIPEDHFIENIGPSSRIHTLDGLEPRKNYVVKVTAYNNIGRGPSAEQQAFTLEQKNPMLESELLAPVEVKVRVISPTSVIVTWYDNTLGQNQRPLDDRTYRVKYNALPSAAQRKTQFRNTTELFVRVDGLRPYTKYEFSVMTRQESRTSIYSLAARNTTLEDKPGSVPRDLTVTPIENKANMLMVSWQPPSTPNGRLVSYTIYSNTNFEQPIDSWAVDSVPGHSLNYEFGPVTSSTVYFFRIAAHNSKGASQLSNAKALMTPNVLLSETKSGSPSAPDEGKADKQGQAPVPKGPQTAQPQGGVPSARTLWIIIACVSAVTALAIAALIAVLCRRKILSNRKRPATLKASNQAPRGMNRNCKQQAPDLWMGQDQVELKALRKETDPHELIDERTSMIQSQGSQFDVASASMMGDGYMDEPRYSTLGRQRPVIIAPQQYREAMPRAAVQPMTADHGRPMYPRTQFAAHAYGSTPRVHVGDTSHPTNESYLHSTSTPINKPYMINGEEVPPPRPPPMEGRPYPLRSFNNTNGVGQNIPKHIVKPQPVSVFKPAEPLPTEPISFNTDSLKRPPRPPYANRQNSQGSVSKENLKLCLKTGSTEQLNSDMAHLDDIMQDFNSMKNDFECTT